MTDVSSGGWFNIGKAAGRSLYRLPLALREPDEGVTHVSTLTAAYNDPWVNPCSGGIFGQQAIAEALDLSLRQAQRRVFHKPIGNFIRWVDGLPATNVQSCHAPREQLKAEARAAHLPNLRQFTNRPKKLGEY